MKTYDFVSVWYREFHERLFRGHTFKKKVDESCKKICTQVSFVKETVDDLRFAWCTISTRRCVFFVRRLCMCRVRGWWDPPP